MAEYLFLDENGHAEFDFSRADTVIELHEKYKYILLSDVDFIVEQSDKILLVEYKNSSVPDAVDPEAFKIKDDKHYNRIARKYYDSIIYLMACGKNRPFEYIYILEADKSDIVIRKLVEAKIKKQLPFDLQQTNSEIARELISEFHVVNIDEWNREFPDYQIRRVAEGD